MRFWVLGPLLVTREGNPVSIGGHKPRVLLATLLLSPSRPVTLDHLAGRLWEADPPADPRRAIQVYVTRLRAAMGTDADLLTTTPGGYQLTVEPAQLDLLRFSALLAEAEQAQDDPTRVRLLTKALGLWRGPACADVPSQALRNQDAYRLDEQRLLAEERRADAQLRLGLGADLVPGLLELTAQVPLRERFWAQLMLALHAAGRQSEALQAYRTIAGLLLDELGVDPGEGLRQVQSAVLNDDVRHIAPAAGSTRPVPREIPLDVAHFTGRVGQLAMLDKLLAGRPDDSPTTVAVIDGPPGTGKTALVTHWAHRRRVRFPDGQLFINLRGHGPGEPLSTHAAMGGFLRSLGVAPDAVPADPDERSALFRSVSSGKELLLVLDNARDAAQVRPLLPGSGGLVVVTSRHRLRGLVAREGATRLALAPFGQDEAVELLAEVIGVDRVAAEPEATRELAGRCGGLPLALVILGERLSDGASIGELVGLLRDERDRLAAFDLAGDCDSDLRAALVSGLRALPPEASRAFAMLSLHPGQRFGVPAVAALTGSSPAQAYRLAELLADTHHVQRPAPGRYEFHDLLRLFAADQARALPPAERQAAIKRILSWYLHSCDASVYKFAGRRPPELAPLAEHVTPARFTSDAQAVDWFGTELGNLSAAVRMASAQQQHQHAWQIAARFQNYLENYQRWADHTDTYTVALASARAVGNVAGEALLRMRLGNNQLHLGHHEEGIGSLREAHRLRRQLGDLQGQAVCLGNIGRGLFMAGRLDEAISELQRALSIYRATGHRSNEGHTLQHLGMCHLGAGRHAIAGELTEKALTILRDAGEKSHVAIAHGQLGDVHLAAGRSAVAVGHLRTALSMLKDLGGSDYEMDGLTSLAVALSADDPAQAAVVARQAEALLRGHDTPSARRMLERLAPVLGASSAGVAGLGEETGRTASQGTGDVVVLAEGGEHDDLGVGERPADLGGGQAIELRHPHVEHSDVGPVREGQVDGVAAVASLGHHLDVGVGTEDGAYLGADHQFVVGG